MTADFTVGVEEEYQLVDPVTRELRSRAGDVLRADWSREMTPEFHQTMVEVGTPVCTSIAALGRELRRLRTQAASAAAAEELEIVAAGVHPFSRWEGHRFTASERYERLFERFGRVVRTEHVFGMHVHVAIPEGMDRLHLINGVREWLPYLTALAASSPFYEGEDMPARMPLTWRNGPPMCMPLAVDGELADVLVVAEPAHLEHREAAAHLAVHLHVAQQDDGVGEVEMWPR
jgi:glutamate---cysteine ligase / carboxylate-amine ligase